MKFNLAKRGVTIFQNVKIIFAFILISIISIKAHAQNPIAGDNQVTLGIQHNSGFFLFKHYSKDNLVKRYGISGGYNYSNNNGNALYTDRNAKITSLMENGNLGISFGLQKNFLSIENLEPYLGIDLVLNYSFYASKYVSEITDTIQKSPYYNNGYHIGDYTKESTKSPGSIGATLRPLIGFNYYLKKNFAIGLEYQINFLNLSYKMKEERRSQNKYQGEVGEMVKTITPGGINFSTYLSGITSLTASFYFK